MFFHPFLFAMGLAGASLPLLVHWLTKPRPVRMPLSTIHLVSDALAGRRSRDRIRDFLVLFLRCLAMALLAITIARPLMDGNARPTDAPPADRVRVVLVDASGSMSAIEDSTTRFDRARAAAVKELKFRTGLSANVLIASNSPGAVFEQPSGNLQLLRQRLGEAAVTDAAMNVSAAMEEAGRQLAISSGDASSSEVVRELVIVSDFQRTNWSRAGFGSLPDDVEVRLVPIGQTPNKKEEQETLSNLAISEVRLSTSATMGKPLSLAVDVANYSDDSRLIRCVAEIGTTPQTVEATINPFETATLSIPVDWNQSGWQTGQVRLLDTGDARPIDDVYPLAIGVRPELRYAIITDELLSPGVDAYFIAKVLQREAVTYNFAGETDSRVEVLTSDRLDTPLAQIANVWVLSDLELWNERVAGQVAARLRQGKSVLYIAGHPADANHLKELQDLLADELRPPVELIASLESDSRRDLSIQQADGDHLPFSVFGSLLDQTVSTWRIGGGLPTRMLDQSGIDQVAANLSDRSALLYFADVGSGRLGVLNADLSRSNVAYQAGFVPFIVETLHRLTDAGGDGRGTISGQPLYRELPSGTGSANELTLVRASTPKKKFTDSVSGEDSMGNIQRRDGLTIWNWPSAESQGLYQVKNESGKTVWAEAIRSDPNEQDLSVLTTDVVQERLAGGRQLELQSSGKATGDEDTLWIWAAIGMLACVFGEWATLLGFRS